MSYLLQTGEKDNNRLDILSEVYNSGSQNFITKNINKNISSIIEVGCGQGHMISWFEKYFNKAQITGIDSSEDQLSLSKQKFNNHKINFINIDILDDNFINKFQNLKNADFIYCRYLLLHLPYEKWGCFFNNIFHLLKQGASLILEEPGLPAVSYPFIKSLDIGTHLTKKFTEEKGLRFDCIEPLWNYTKKIQNLFKIEDLNFNQPILISTNAKSLLSQSFDQIIPALINSKVAEEDKIKAISKDINNMVNNPDYIATAFRVIQLHLKKV